MQKKENVGNAYEVSYTPEKKNKINYDVDDDVRCK